MIARRRRKIWRDPAAWIFAAIIIAILVGSFFVRRWEYRECRTVGHSVFYCLTHDGGNK